MRAIVTVVSLVCLLVGCQNSPKRSLASKLEPYIGRQVTLVGIAEPRKSGAALVGEDFTVWLKDVSFWPENVSRKKVEVVGRLEEDHGLPVIGPTKEGELPLQGIPVPAGTDLNDASRRLVLVNAKWRIIE